MIIGNGLISSAFKIDYENNDKILIFASGVSNSLETSSFEFDREKKILQFALHENKNKIIIYFTSFLKESNEKRKYIQHKNEMESIIKSSGNHYCILKIPQVIGNGGNPKNLFNFIINKILSEEVLKIYKNSYRSLIDVDDIKLIVDILLKEWKENIYIEFPGFELISVTDIVLLIGEKLKLIPNIEYIESDNYFLPKKSQLSNDIINSLNIISKGYTRKIINKYINNE